MSVVAVKLNLRIGKRIQHIETNIIGLLFVLHKNNNYTTITIQQLHKK